ncbi:hypothetical protein GCM10023090_28620 [Acidovorax lacteus]|uniref:Uncharacterized protein n=1 Tax=Acidovorax lacteus TaxID=1924988 RepID=A0ABP8LGV5_9BURK
MRLKGIGRRLQAVVHMQRLHLTGPSPCTGQQQGRGVCSSAQAYQQRERGIKGLKRFVEGTRGWAALRSLLPGHRPRP